MSKNEFLHTMCEKLKEGLTTSQMEEHVRYYNDYIDQEVSSGKPETEVIASLGDPTLLARTILETPGAKSHGGVYQEEFSEDVYEEDGDRQQQQQGALFQISSMSSWGCIATVIAAMLIIGFVLWLFGIVFKAFMPVIMPVLLVLFIVALFKQRR